MLDVIMCVVNLVLMIVIVVICCCCVHACKGDILVCRKLVIMGCVC